MKLTNLLQLPQGALMDAFFFAGTLSVIFRNAIFQNGGVDRLITIFLLIFFSALLAGSIKLMIYGYLISISITSALLMVPILGPFMYQFQTSSIFLTVIGIAVIVVLQIRSMSFVLREEVKSVSQKFFMLGVMFIGWYFGRGDTVSALKLLANNIEDNIVWLSSLASSGTNSSLQFSHEMTVGSGNALAVLLSNIQFEYSYLIGSDGFNPALNPMVLKITYGFVLIILALLTKFQFDLFIHSNNLELGKFGKSILLAFVLASAYSVAATLMSYGHLSALWAVVLFNAGLFLKSEAVEQNGSDDISLLFKFYISSLLIGSALSWFPIFPLVAAIVISMYLTNSILWKRTGFKKLLKQIVILVVLVSSLGLLSPINLGTAFVDFASNLKYRGGIDIVSPTLMVVVLMVCLFTYGGRLKTQNKGKITYIQGAQNDVYLAISYLVFIFLGSIFVHHGSNIFANDYYAYNKVAIALLSIFLPISIVTIFTYAYKTMLDVRSAALFLLVLFVGFMQLGSPVARVFYPISTKVSANFWAEPVLAAVEAYPGKRVICLNTSEVKKPASHKMYFCSRYGQALSGAQQDSWPQSVNLRSNFKNYSKVPTESYFANSVVLVSDISRKSTLDINQSKWASKLPWHAMTIYPIK